MTATCLRPQCAVPAPAAQLHIYRSAPGLTLLYDRPQPTGAWRQPQYARTVLLLPEA